MVVGASAGVALVGPLESIDEKSPKINDLAMFVS
jgi:hypothetical protein